MKYSLSSDGGLPRHLAFGVSTSSRSTNVRACPPTLLLPCFCNVAPCQIVQDTSHGAGTLSGWHKQLSMMSFIYNSLTWPGKTSISQKMVISLLGLRALHVQKLYLNCGGKHICWHVQKLYLNCGGKHASSVGVCTRMHMEFDCRQHGGEGGGRRQCCDGTLAQRCLGLLTSWMWQLFLPQRIDRPLCPGGRGAGGKWLIIRILFL